MRHGEVPREPPDDLIAFCIPVGESNDVVNWSLTDDSIAFGDHGVVGRFAEWRSSWEQAWVIGATDMLAIFASTAGGEPDRLSVRQRCLISRLCCTEHAAHGRSFSPIDLADLDDALQTLRNVIHERGGAGFGAVDATPGSRRVGLLRSWVGTPDGTVLSSANGVTVRVDLEGLGLRFDDGRPTLGGITSVELIEASTVVETAAASAVLDAREARSIGWLIPESVNWRVRSLPEAVVWAHTFAAVSDARRLAASLDREAVLHVDLLRSPSIEPGESRPD